ncbi:lysophosphatidic acid receptor 3-like [Physella acuta]|uniref:lysophosphatidic acid receptor 3-like n=1 Tax=Physella acuta TaxID=109671 RepID=UPI0027DAB5F8|nr:lysophosphatidic acid receptor 3-like [Physella acuta]
MPCDLSVICPSDSETINRTKEESINRTDNGYINLTVVNTTALPPHLTPGSGLFPGVPQFTAIVTILCFSAFVFLCSSLVLMATRYTSGGRSATLVFLRSLCLSDILMSTYGVSKMIMLMYLDTLNINFFLPDSLFFTASLASTMSLLSLNIDCYLKLARPLKYAQMDKDTVITIMLLVWNGAFILGFLPLVGWHDHDYTHRFFDFYPWHYLLFSGFIIVVCVVACIACMVSLNKSYTIPKTDVFSTRTLEARKYHHLHRTIIAECVTWLLCYLPFFVYIALACRQCLLSDYDYSDAVVIYFIPVFLVKSLFSSALQAFRTLHVHIIMNHFISEINLIKYFKYRRRDTPKEPGTGAISYINPLCGYHSDPVYGDHVVRIERNQVRLHHNLSETDLTELSRVSETSLNGSSMTGIANLSFKSSIEMTNITQETTSL